MEYSIKFEVEIPVKDSGFSYFSETFEYTSSIPDYKESFIEAANFAYEYCKTRGYQKIVYIKCNTQ